MYKLNCWYKENGTPVRYIRSAETITELWELLTIDVDLTDVLQIDIYKEVQRRPLLSRLLYDMMSAGYNGRTLFMVSH